MSDAFNDMLEARSRRDGWRGCAALLTTASFVGIVVLPTVGPWPVAACAIVAAFSLQRTAEWTAKTRRSESRYAFLVALQKDGKDA